MLSTSLPNLWGKNRRAGVLESNRFRNSDLNEFKNQIHVREICKSAIRNLKSQIEFLQHSKNNLKPPFNGGIAFFWVIDPIFFSYCSVPAKYSITLGSGLKSNRWHRTANDNSLNKPSANSIPFESQNGGKEHCSIC